MKLSTAIAALTVALPAFSSEMIVFRPESSYRGASIKVESYEIKGDKIVLRTSGGDVVSAPKDSIDWDRSQQLTAQTNRHEEAAAATRAEEQRRREAAEAARRVEDLGLVEASRRYGVEKPGMSVGSELPRSMAGGGTAPSERAGDKPGAADKPAGDKPGAAGKPPSSEPPLVAAARTRLESAKAQVETVKKAIEDLEKFPTTDPVLSGKRAQSLETKRRELADAEKRVTSLEQELQKRVDAERDKGV